MRIMAILSETRLRSDPKEKNTVTLWGIAWKAILSEAVVTEGEALGISMLNSCLEGSTSYQTKYIARYCLTDSSPHASNPGTVSRCSSPSGQIASESDRITSLRSVGPRTNLA